MERRVWHRCLERQFAETFNSFFVFFFAVVVLLSLCVVPLVRALSVVHTSFEPSKNEVQDLLFNEHLLVTSRCSILGRACSCCALGQLATCKGLVLS